MDWLSLSASHPQTCSPHRYWADLTGDRVTLWRSGENELSVFTPLAVTLAMNSQEQTLDILHQQITLPASCSSSVFRAVALVVGSTEIWWDVAGSLDGPFKYLLSPRRPPGWRRETGRGSPSDMRYQTEESQPRDDILALNRTGYNGEKAVSRLW